MTLSRPAPDGTQRPPRSPTGTADGELWASRCRCPLGRPDLLLHPREGVSPPCKLWSKGVGREQGGGRSPRACGGGSVHLGLGPGPTFQADLAPAHLP